MSDTPTPAVAGGRRLLKGGTEITEHVIKKKPTAQEVRWFRGQLDAFASVIWRLKKDGELLSWSDELDELLEAKAAQAKADAITAAEAKVVEKEELTKAAAKAARPAPAKSTKSTKSKKIAA